MSERVRVLIVDDDHAVVQMLVATLSLVDEIAVVGTAGDATGGANLAARTRPDVAIVDVFMPGGGGISAMKAIRAACPRTAVVIFTGTGDSNAVIEMFRQGASGFVAKGANLQDLITSVLAAAGGSMILWPEIAASLRRELTRIAHGDLASRIDESARVERLLTHGRIDVVFQPIVELRGRRTRGYEALSRFEDDTPEEWFARAWRVGRGPELELKALELALAAFGKPEGDTYLSLNVSPETLPHRGLIEALQTSRPDRIVLEITEHAEIPDFLSFQRALHTIRGLGVRIAVDDAGAGFANLVRLVQVVPDVIKLDRFIVSGIHRDRIKRAVVRSLILLTQGIGALLAGEGVETESEAEALLDLGVRFGQGYLFGKAEPMPQGLTPVET